MGATSEVSEVAPPPTAGPAAPAPGTEAPARTGPALPAAAEGAKPAARRAAGRSNESVGPVFVPPMKPGDLIAGNQPGVEEPEVKVLALPVYPAEARGSGRSVTVRVRVLVDEGGKVVETRVVGPDPSLPGFDRAAREAASRSIFFPATRDGVAGKMWSEVEFQLVEPPAAHSG